jgi:pyruvate ferredoxin oxidoreductase delta subunit
MKELSFLGEKGGWQELPEGGIIPEGGTARYYNTGSWRTSTPIWDASNCNNCLLCWIYCPEAAILVKEAKLKGIDYFYCKGCGICAKVCPKNTIKMETGAT